MSETLTHNPKNAVTGRIERVREGERTVVVKELSRRNRPDTRAEWRASDEPRHWNYWAREACVYESDLAAVLTGTDVRLPQILAIKKSEQSRLWR